MNEPVAGCAVVVFIVLALPAVIFMIHSAVQGHDRRNKRRAETLGALAARWGGDLTLSYFAAEHRLSLVADGFPGLVTFQAGGKNQQAWTRVQFQAPSRRRLRVTPEGFTGWLSRIFGGGDVRVGDPAFDESFWVESSDEAWAREVLDAPLRGALFRLRETHHGFGSGTVTLDAGPSGVNLRVSVMLVDEPAHLGSLIECAVEALRRIHGRSAVGVVMETVEMRAGSECPVCGHPVEGGKKCPSCGTPHHGDCWKYSAGCAIFGCSARKGAA